MTPKKLVESMVLVIFVAGEISEGFVVLLRVEVLLVIVMAMVEKVLVEIREKEISEDFLVLVGVKVL